MQNCFAFFVMLARHMRAFSTFLLHAPRPLPTPTQYPSLSAPSCPSFQFLPTFAHLCPISTLLYSCFSAKQHIYSSCHGLLHSFPTTNHDISPFISHFLYSNVSYRIPDEAHPCLPAKYTSYPPISRRQTDESSSSKTPRHRMKPMEAPSLRPFRAPMKPTRFTRRSPLEWSAINKLDELKQKRHQMRGTYPRMVK